jgi:hypothetical protein
MRASRLGDSGISEEIFLTVRLVVSDEGMGSVTPPYLI